MRTKNREYRALLYHFRIKATWSLSLIIIFFSTSTLHSQHLAEIAQTLSVAEKDQIEKAVKAYDYLHTLAPGPERRDTDAMRAMREVSVNALAKAVTSKPDSSVKKLEANAAVLGSLGLEVSPTVSASVTYKAADRVYGSILILTSPMNPDSAVRVNASRLFIPENSALAMMVNATWQPFAKVPAGLNLSASAGQKKFYRDTARATKQVVYSVLGHVDLLGEYLVAKDAWSVYGGIGYSNVLMGRDNYDSYFGTDKGKEFTFWQFGVRALFDSKVAVDLRVIFLSDRMKELLMQKDPDPVIISLRLSAIQDLL
jgi:hypothetical protein